MLKAVLVLTFALLPLAVLAACGDDGRPFRQGGASMQPSIDDGDEVTVREYGSQTVARDDIVLFSGPFAVNRGFLKRVIGLPGDTVSIDEDDGSVRVNGELVTEPYIQGTTRCGEACVVAVPASERTTLHPPNPRPTEVDPAVEEAKCRETGCYFVMGDNRQNSADSRQGWLVPAENIIGWVDEP